MLLTIEQKARCMDAISGGAYTITYERSPYSGMKTFAVVSPGGMLMTAHENLAVAVWLHIRPDSEPVPGERTMLTFEGRRLRAVPFGRGLRRMVTKGDRDGD